MLRLSTICWLHKEKINWELQEAYWNYFKTNCSDIGKNFAPSYICATCHRNLYRYHRNNQFKFLFLVALQFGLNALVMNTGFAISAQFRSLYWNKKLNILTVSIAKCPDLICQIWLIVQMVSLSLLVVHHQLNVTVTYNLLIKKPSLDILNGLEILSMIFVEN